MRRVFRQYQLVCMHGEFTWLTIPTSVAYTTAAAAVYHALQISLPFLPEGRPDGYKPQSVLVCI